MNNIEKDIEFILNIKKNLYSNKMKLIYRALKLQNKYINFLIEYNKLYEFVEKSKKIVIKYNKIKNKINYMLNNVNQLEKNIFFNYFLKNITSENISKNLKISKRTVQRKIQKIKLIYDFLS